MILRLVLSVGALVTGLVAQDNRASHKKAISLIKQLGGEVIVHSDKPGNPVTVALTGSSSPADCLPHLQAVKNLQTCDM